MKSSEMFGGFIFLSYLCSVRNDKQNKYNYEKLV